MTWQHTGKRCFEDEGRDHKPSRAGSHPESKEARNGFSSAKAQPHQHPDFSFRRLIAASDRQNYRVINGVFSR